MSGKTKIAALLHSQPGIHKLKLLIGKALCILLFYSQSLTAAQTLLFSDDFDNTVSDSITDPSARAKGNLSSLLRYSWTSNPSQEIEIVDGKFDWIGETDNKGRLLTSVGANIMRFKTSNGSEINWNENNRLNGTRYEISLTYRTAWSHYLNFNLLDTLPNNKVDLSSDVQGDFVFGTNGTSVRTATDGSDFNYIANKVQADTTYQVRLLVNELAYPKTVQIYLDDVKITEEPIIITFENEERYFMFSNSGKYGGYIDNFNVSVHKPNVIIIYSDDHGYTDLGVQEIDPNVKTPNMDLLAQNGVRFTDGYCTAPQCVPSRGGLMAGRYQNRFGLRGNGGGSEGGLPVTEPCVAERFQELGYRTGMIGKWHLGGGDRAPKNRGFNNYWDGALYTVERNFNLDAEELATSETVELPALPNRCIAQGKAAEAFVELNKDEPFFLYFAVYGPHNPLIDKEDPYFLNFPEVDYPHLNDEQDVVRRQGLALIHAVDDAVGGLINKLDSLGLIENTLIVFASDNGAQPKLWSTASEDVLKWDGSDNVPMRGEKGSLWEGGIRVPMFAYWPGVIPAGQTINDPVISLDFVATTHKLINGVIPEEFDGVDLLPRLTSAAESVERPNPLFWDYENELATREGDWKLRRSASGDYLFNLKEDPYELQNLAYRETEKRDYLIEKLNEYEASLPESGRADITPPSISDNVYVKGARFLGRYTDDRYILPETDTPSVYPAPIVQDKLIIEAEHYDEGQNVGYYDSTAGNYFGDYRADDVDIKITSVTYVSNITSGEWLKYTVNQDFNVTPTYTIQASLASPRDSAGEIEIYFDDTYIATVPVNNTGGINKFKLTALNDVTLPTNVQEVKLSFKAFTGKYSFDRIEFIPEVIEE